ncbi:MAG: TIGR03564 family F420-dependent LLM class oxidoreductase [Acidimicrobiales bacterium]|nr:TIGR03564 family F420-dependent LLM class oxidoreductase [Acidimicrobiales bacterium]MCB1245861.1 TIGR03564 family F420-dependent LLM class oxidoreductase [Acidimicrobiia bacterium]
MRYGINGSGRMLTNGVQGVLEDLKTAEVDGFSSYWVAQVGLIDALTLLGAHGRTGSSMALGTAVISTWERHPHALATQALTTQALVGDRLVVGIGVNHRPHVEQSLRMNWDRPVRHMSEYLAILGDLLAGGATSRQGDIWSFDGQAARPSDGVPKVMIAALGEQMLRLAGRRTDGTILWCVGPETIRTHIAPTINQAASAAGRPAPSIVCSLPVWVTDDPAPAREFLAAILADYATLPSYRAMMDIEGVHGLGDLSIVGPEDEVREQLARVEASGATDFTPVPMGGNPDEEARTRSVLLEAMSAT